MIKAGLNLSDCAVRCHVAYSSKVNNCGHRGRICSLIRADCCLFPNEHSYIEHICFHLVIHLHGPTFTLADSEIKSRSTLFWDGLSERAASDNSCGTTNSKFALSLAGPIVWRDCSTTYRHRWSCWNMTTQKVVMVVVQCRYQTIGCSSGSLTSYHIILRSRESDLSKMRFNSFSLRGSTRRDVETRGKLERQASSRDRW